MTGRLDILKRIESGQALPSLSPLTIKLIETASDDSCSAQDVADIIKQDPSLTTRLLKLSNSAFFRSRERVSTLTRAVVHLGVNRIRSLALGISLRDTFPLGVRGNMNYDAFWKVSLYRAMIAQEFSRKTGEANPEEAFIAGLILEIGLLMLYGACTADQQTGFPKEALDVESQLKWEEDNIGIDHRNVGKIILTKWRFPASLIEPQEYWDEAAFSQETPPLTKLCELARLGSETFFAQGTSLNKLHTRAYRLYSLPPKESNDILLDVLSHVEETAEALQIETSKEKDLVAILERANYALQRLNLRMADQIQEYLDRAETQFNREPDCNDTRLYQIREQAIESALQAVAHEIRNPLLSLGGFVQRLSKSLHEQNDYIEKILSEATRIDHVLRDLSDFSKKYHPQFQTVNIAELLDETLEKAAAKLAARGIQIVKQYSRDDTPTLYLDREGMSQVFARLLWNALNSAPSQGRIVVTIQEHPRYRELSVGFEDSGAALDEKTIAILSDPIINSKTFGAGLGMPTARKIIAWHGGRVELKKGNLDGKKVEIFLPLSDEEP